MNLGADIGRSQTKVAIRRQRAMFDSIIGTKAQTTFAGIADKAFSLNGSTAVVVEHPKFGKLEYEVGGNALAQSATTWAPRHREQLEQDILVLLSYGLKELRAFGDLHLCVGTPAAFYDIQKPVLESLFKQPWVVDGHEVAVSNVVVLPQPVGTAWNLAVDATGKPRPEARAFFGQKVGILDVGEYSTDAIVLDNMRYLARSVVTIEYGCGKVAEAVAAYLTDQGYPRLPHQVGRAILDRKLAGIDLEDVVEEAVSNGIRAILSEVGARWDDRPEFSRVIVTGGGAYLFGQRIKQAWGAEVVSLPEWANVLGYLAFLMFLARNT